MKKKHGRFVRGLRRLGLMMGLELIDESSGPLLTKTAYDHDLLMVYANNDPSVCQLLPPLTIRPEQVDWAMGRLDQALAAARRLRPAVKIKNQINHLLGRVRK